MPDTVLSKRRYATKGKGGCDTCKLRHVRCDEQKPRCTPCYKSRRPCEYSADPVRRDLDHMKIVMWQPNDLSLQRLSPDPNHSKEEARAFDFFRVRVATSLGGFFDASFWTRDVLQAAQQESSIRHAVIALASMSEHMLKSNEGSRQPLGQLEAFAIQQHCKAITGVNQKLQNQKQDQESMDTVLVTCVLLLYLEMLQNHYESALRQLSSGIYVFCDWQTKARKPSQATSVRSGRDSGELATKLSHVFGRLMLQALLFVDTRLFDLRLFMPAFTPAMPFIPLKFKTMNESRDCLNSCMCSLLHGIYANRVHGSEEENIIHVTVTHPPQSARSPLDQWLASFKAFVEDRTTTLTAKEQQGAIILEMQHTVGSIMASIGPFILETVFDVFEHRFSKIVALSSRIISNDGTTAPDPQHLCPAFDMGILPPLYYVASRCRNPSIRRQALDLLRKGPSQEAIWHRDMLVNIAERIIVIEEMGCVSVRSCADIPATARLSMLNATIHSAQRTVELHCGRQQSDDSERVEVLHELVSY